MRGLVSPSPDDTRHQGGAARVSRSPWPGPAPRPPRLPPAQPLTGDWGSLVPPHASVFTSPPVRGTSTSPLEPRCLPSRASAELLRWGPCSPAVTPPRCSATSQARASHGVLGRRRLSQCGLLRRAPHLMHIILKTQKGLLISKRSNSINCFIRGCV